ncbi:MAG: DUF4097 family beta strand repeat-containing protein [bacterium]
MRARDLFLVIVLMIPSLLLGPPPSNADREVEAIEEKNFKMDPGGTVKVTANGGYVRITAWDRSEVSIKMAKYARGRSKREAQRRLEEIVVVIEQRGDRLTIRERKPESRSFSIFDLFDPDTWAQLGGRIAWVDFDLTVPRETNCIIITDEGDVTVSHIEGEINIDTDEGETELRRICSDRLSVMTDEGEILLEHIRGQGSSSSSRVKIDTDEGDAELVDVKVDRVEIESDEGDAVADMLRCQRLDFYSDEGTIEADLDILPGGDYRCRTDEGEIVLFLSDEASFTITARSQEGEIRSDFSLEVKGAGEGERADGAVGRGGADLYLFTEEGDIRLRKR